jgi:endo-1,4-beta-xylanase
MMAAAGLAAALATGMAACTEDEQRPTPTTEQQSGLPMPEFDRSRESNLLAAGNWEFMPGVEADSNGGLQVSRTGLAIRKEKDEWQQSDAPEYFPVTPINAWTHVEMSQEDGNVGLAAKLSGIEGRATMLFQGDPTFRYDERIYQHAAVGLDIEGNTATVNVWFGSGEEPNITEQIDLGAAVSEADVALAQVDNALVISANGKTITIPDARVFESGQIWLGLDASAQWRLDQLTAYPLGDNQLEVVDSTEINFGELDPEGLQAVVAQSRPDLVIGTAVDIIPLTYDEEYAQLVAENTGGWATEMLAKPQNLQPERGTYVWDDFDAFVDLAQRHNKQIHGHTLVFGEANPAWMEEAVANASPEEALEIMREHITAVVSRHEGEVATWDVINEPFDEDDWSAFRPHLWYEAIGEQYIEEAFRVAHEADPNALLGINDWALEHDPDRWDALIDLLTDLQSKDVPVHYVGFQAHLDPDDINELLSSDILAQRFRQLEDMGIKVRISEISVEGEDPQLQAETYAKVLRTCMEAENCIAVNFWGLASNETYFTTEPNGNYSIPPEQFGNDAPWQQNEDGSYSRKRAADALFAAAQAG